MGANSISNTTMKKIGFIRWYFTQGLSSYFRVWKNFLQFVLHFFNIKGLFSSLFSPWKKDIVPKDWQGFHPLLSLQVIIANFFFRIFGAIARTVVILAGLAIEFLMAVGGAFFLLAWLLWPLLVVLSLWGIMNQNLLSIVLMAVLVPYAAVIFLGYRRDQQEPLSALPISELAKMDFFKRVYSRLGLSDATAGAEAFNDQAKLKQLLATLNISEQEFNHIVAWEIFTQEKKTNKSAFWTKDHLLQHGPIGKYWKFGYTSLLNQFAHDMTKYDGSAYADLELFHHDQPFKMLQLVLAKRSENCALLSGDQGAGKRGIIHFLAKVIRTNQLQDPLLKDKRILLLDLSAALSSAASQGRNLPDFVHHLFFEAVYAGNVVLVIEGIERYLGQKQDEFHVDISPLLEEYLAYPTFQIIATTTGQFYHQLIERNKNIMQHFELVDVPEMDEKQSMEVVLERYEALERDRVVFTYAGLRNVVKRSNQIADAVVLPQRALDMAMELLLYWKDHQSQFVTAELVDEFVSAKTGIPLGKIGGAEKDLLMNMEKALHERVVGQEEAITQIAQAIRKVRSGIGNTKKPIGSFLFLGPTGVGKTEAAKALAEAYFGDEQRMIRLDMSEYQGASALEWMIGSSQNNLPGRLTSQAKDNPFSLLLLDEIEKANPNVLDLFLQILDEGSITDAFGEKVSFKNMIIIATSNAGSTVIKDAITQKQPGEAIRSGVIDHVVSQGIFRLEFLNRFDGIIFFRPLNQDELVKVVRLMLDNLSARIGKEKNIYVTFADDLIPLVIEKGYEPIFGARSLNRYISDTIEDLIAKKIIMQSLGGGASLTVSAQDLAVTAS